MPVSPVHAHAIHATTHLRRITGARHIAFGLEGLLRAGIGVLATHTVAAVVSAEIFVVGMETLVATFPSGVCVIGP